MIGPQKKLYPEARTEAPMVCFRIISRRSWDNLQSLHQAFPESRVERVMEGTGIFVLHIPAGGAKDLGR